MGGNVMLCFFFQAEDGIRDLVRSRGLGDVYKRQEMFLASSGLHAIWAYRVAHRIWARPGGKLLARLISRSIRCLNNLSAHGPVPFDLLATVRLPCRTAT